MKKKKNQILTIYSQRLINKLLKFKSYYLNIIKNITKKNNQK
jgi:hypothetical protein